MAFMEHRDFPLSCHGETPLLSTYETLQGSESEGPESVVDPADGGFSAMHNQSINLAQVPRDNLFGSATMPYPQRIHV